MNAKRTFSTEISYLFGIIFLALGTAFMEKAGFGMSMVVAPAYLVFLEVSRFVPFFTFGMAEYCLQAVLLVLMALIGRRFKMMYLFSFVTAVVYGVTLDLMIALVGLFEMNAVLLFALGLVVCSFGVTFFFHSYIAPEAYELFVKELSQSRGYDIHKVKTLYDITSCLVAIILSFAFFGLWHFEGVKWGTVLCALVNGYVISRCSALLEHFFVFEDSFPRLRRLFDSNC